MGRRWRCSPSPDLIRHVGGAYRCRPASLPVVSGDLPAVVSAERTARGLQLTVDTEAPALVVISEWQLNGWRATLEDRTELPILRANAGLSAIVAPAGKHTISLSYRPLDVCGSGWLSRFSVWIWGNRGCLVLAAGNWHSSRAIAGGNKGFGRA
ncbi:MAG: hypothetical protein R3C44_11435 [Chloroflexota bacterium]